MAGNELGAHTIDVRKENARHPPTSLVTRAGVWAKQRFSALCVYVTYFGKRLTVAIACRFVLADHRFPI